MVRFKQFFLNIRNPFDKADGFYSIGILSLGKGLWLLEPWISLSVCGTLFIVFGVLQSVFGGRK